MLEMAVGEVVATPERPRCSKVAAPIADHIFPLEADRLAVGAFF